MIFFTISSSLYLLAKEDYTPKQEPAVHKSFVKFYTCLTNFAYAASRMSEAISLSLRLSAVYLPILQNA